MIVIFITDSTTPALEAFLLFKFFTFDEELSVFFID